MTNRSEISAPPQKNSPSNATAACQVCSPTSESVPPIILRLTPPSPTSSSRNSRRTSTWCLVRQTCGLTVACVASRSTLARRLNLWPSQLPDPDDDEVICGVDGDRLLSSSFVINPLSEVKPQSKDSAKYVCLISAVTSASDV